MALQRGNDKYGDTFPPHPQRHKLHSEGLACATGTKNRHIRVLVHRTIKDVHDDKGAVVLVDTKQNAVIIAHLITGKWVAACSAACQQITLTALIEPLFHIHKGQGREKRLFLPKMAIYDVHILGKKQFSHFADFPFQLLFIGSSNGNQQVEIIEIFVIGQAIFEVIAAPDRIIDLVKVRIGIISVFQLGTVDTELLTDRLNDSFLRLTGKKHIHVHTVTGIDDQA